MNLDKLEVALQKDPSQVTVDELNEWYEQFLVHEVTGEEPPEDLNLIHRGLKWLMQYEHTNAEELRELAEQQAIENAEKEENWELERENLMEQISELRENITSKAGVDMTSEAFRAEIDSLRAESNHLKQINRDRDIELAEQRDKMEEYLERVGVLENERRNLTNAQIQLEDANKELTRRISRMTEDTPIGDRSESRMLRQRHEQAIELSNQLRSVITQNEELEKRAESLSQSLEEATALIREANLKNETLREQLDKANNTLDKVAEENVNMKRILDGKDEQLFATKKSTEMTEKQWEDLVRQKDIQLHRLRDNTKKYETEISDLRSKIQSDYTLEREQELEKLRVELVEATNLAREMFGEHRREQDGTKQDATSQIRSRMVHMNKELGECREQLKKVEEERKSLEKQLENKDTQLAKAHGDLGRLRQQLFGSTDEFVRDLERQLEFRDRQIAQLTVKCSLLQLELEKEDEQGPSRSAKPESTKSPDSLTAKPPKPPKQRRSRPKSATHYRPRTTDRNEPSSTRLEDRNVQKEHEEDQVEDGQSSPSSSSSSSSFDWDEEKKRLMKEMREKRTKEALEFIEKISEEINTTVPFDAIAPLYNELKAAHEKLKAKDSLNDQLKESTKTTRMTILSLKTELTKAKKELDDFKDQILGPEWANPNDSDLRRELESLKVANMEFQHLADSIKMNGTDMERRFEESSRRLIHLGIENNRLERQLNNSNKLKEVISTQYQSAQLKLTSMNSEIGKNVKLLVKENEQNILEIARLQNIVFHSVPMKTYDGLLKKYKGLLYNYTVTILGKSEAEADAGYESDIDDRNFDISLAPALTAEMSLEELIAENKSLKETTEILEKQLQYWQRKNDEKREEVDHLQSFVDELKKGTDLKSLLANMQDRFMLALQEKNDGLEEQMANERDLRKLSKELNSTKKLWKLDRQRLVEVVLALQFNIEKLRAKTAKSLTVSQLHALAELSREMKDKLTYLDTRSRDLEVKEIETEASRTSYEAKRESIEELLEFNMDLERAQVRMANVLTQFNLLKAEKSRGDAKIKQLEETVRLKDEELDDLKAELNEVEMMKIDLKPLQDLPKNLNLKSPESNRSEKSHSNAVDELSSRSSTSSTSSSSANGAKILRNLPKPMIVDNSKQYEVEIERLKEMARVSIESLQAQLSQKDKTIEEYKELLERVSNEAALQAQETPEAIHEEERQQFLTRLSSYDSNEDANRELIALKWEKKELEEVNAQLAERLRDAQESAGRRRESRDKDVKKEGKEMGIQANIKRRSRSSAPSKSASESDPSTSDSGTVDDFDQPRRPRSHSSHSSTPSKHSEASKGTGSTYTKPADNESQLFRHRNELRKLRLRLMNLEATNRELRNELESLKERYRFHGQRNPDPNAEVNIYRRDNDRLKRDIAHLQKANEEQKNRLQEMEKKEKRSMSSLDTVKLWEDKKRIETERQTLEQRCSKLQAKIKDLQNGQERRDKLIEKLKTSTGINVGATTRLQKEVEESRRRMGEMQTAEEQMRKQITVLQNTIKDTTERLAIMARERQSLVQKMHRQTSTAQPNHSSISVQTAAVPTRSQPSSPIKSPTKSTMKSNVPSPQRAVTTSSHKSTNTMEYSNEDEEKLVEQARELRLENMKLIEELEILRKEYTVLDLKFSTSKNLQKRSIHDHAAIKLLEDKLKGKEREIQHMREKISELEDQVQWFRLRH